MCVDIASNVFNKRRMRDGCNTIVGNVSQMCRTCAEILTSVCRTCVDWAVAYVGCVTNMWCDCVECVSNVCRYRADSVGISSNVCVCVTCVESAPTICRGCVDMVSNLYPKHVQCVSKWFRCVVQLVSNLCRCCVAWRVMQRVVDPTPSRTPTPSSFEGCDALGDRDERGVDYLDLLDMRTTSRTSTPTPSAHPPRTSSTQT